MARMDEETGLRYVPWSVRPSDSPSGVRSNVRAAHVARRATARLSKNTTVTCDGSVEFRTPPESGSLVQCEWHLASPSVHAFRRPPTQKAHHGAEARGEGSDEPEPIFEPDQRQRLKDPKCSTNTISTVRLTWKWTTFLFVTESRLPRRDHAIHFTCVSWSVAQVTESFFRSLVTSVGGPSIERARFRVPFRPTSDMVSGDSPDRLRAV